MIFWLLRPVNWQRPGQPPEWTPWFDKAFGHVVLAKDEETARWLASSHAGDEKAGARLDPAKSTCRPLDASRHVEGVIITDFSAAVLRAAGVIE